MDRIETLASALEQDADQIDQDLGVARRGFHRGGMAQIGLHGMDLADAAERLQVEGEVGAAHRHPDAIVALGQGAHNVAAEKARATIDGDEGVGWALCGHAGLDRVNGGDAWKPGQYRIGQGLYRGWINAPVC